MRARTASGCSAAGTSALTQGQAPTSAPLADGCTEPSGLSTRGPTSASDPQRLGGEPVEPVVEQLRVGVEQHGRLAGRLAHADVRAGAEAEVLIQPMNRCSPFHSAAASAGESVDALSTTISC